MISADIGCCIYNNTDSFPVPARDETVLDESTQAQFHIVATPPPPPTGPVICGVNLPPGPCTSEGFVISAAICML